MTFACATTVCLINRVVGKDMGDGWETKRSRQEGHKEYVIIQLYVVSSDCLTD